MSEMPQWNDYGFDEPERIVRWRYHEFRLMEFDKTDARILADSAVDLHRMAELLAADCPPALAIEILK